MPEFCGQFDTGRTGTDDGDVQCVLALGLLIIGSQKSIQQSLVEILRLSKVIQELTVVPGAGCTEIVGGTADGKEFGVSVKTKKGLTATPNYP